MPTATKRNAKRSRHTTFRHYFVAEAGQLHKISRDHMEAVWLGEVLWDFKKQDHDLRILSIVHDETKSIVACYFVRVSVVAGQITSESQHDARMAHLRQAMLSAHGDRNLLPDFVRQTAGFPQDWATQIAGALDVDVDRLHHWGVGGPLLTATGMGISTQKAARIHAESNRLSLTGERT